MVSVKKNLPLPQKKNKFLELLLFASTCAAAQAESRSVWVCSAISPFSPGFHDFPKFLPGGPKGGGRPDGQLFPHKLPTACPNLSLGSVAAAGRRSCQEVFSMLSRLQTGFLYTLIHITPLTSFSPLSPLAAPLAHGSDAINLGSS